MCNANEEWYQAGKPRKTDNSIFQNRKEQKMYFRKTYGCEIARRELQLRENIMTTRTRDCKTFHFLIKKKQNKKNPQRIAQRVHKVNGEIHTGDQNIMEGFRTHF